MTSSSSPRRRRTRLLGATALASAVVAGTLTSLGGGTAVAAPLPAPPVVGPSSGSGTLKEVVLDWAPVAGAVSYVVQVGRDDEWSDEPTLERTTPGTQLTLPAWLPHASYVWRVAAVGVDGQGRWSVTDTFARGWGAAPEPLAPSGPVDPAEGVPTFRWSPVPTASEYQLQVSTRPFSSAAHRTQAGVRTESCFTTRTAITPANGQAAPRNDGAGPCVFSLLGTGETLHWRVRALDHVVDGVEEVDTTPVVDEGLSSAPPAPMDELDTSACPEPPAPMAPAAPVGGVPSPTTAPSASPSASASATPSAGPSAGAPSSGGCTPAHAVEKGPWSSSTPFSSVLSLGPAGVAFADLPPAGRPTASSDVCRGAVCRDFPTVSWPRVAGAQWYRVTVALDAEFTNIQEIAETPASQWTPTTAWRDSTPAAAFHVVVQACTVRPTLDDRQPGCDEPSEPLVFSKTSPRLASLAPAHDASVGGPDVVLTWQPFSAALSAAVGGPATSEAYAYRVQVTTQEDEGFAADGLDEAVVDGTSHVVAGEEYPDGTYLWRVQPIDASGHALPWSTPRSFSRDSTPPTFAVTSAAALPSAGPVVVRFSEPVTGVNARSTSLSGVLATVRLSADGRSALLAPGRALLAGAGHVVTVTSEVRDRAGNPLVGAALTVTVDPTVDDRSSAMVLRGSWKRLSASNAVARTWSRSVPTPARPTSASTSLHGRGVEVRGCVGPTHGLAELWTDGVRVAQVDTYRAYSGCGVLLSRAAFPTAGANRVELRGVGAKNDRSRGTAVAVDAIVAVR